MTDAEEVERGWANPNASWARSISAEEMARRADEEMLLLEDAHRRFAALRRRVVDDMTPSDRWDFLREGARQDERMEREQRVREMRAGERQDVDSLDYVDF